MITTRTRVTFESFDTTSEVSGLDGSTFTVALVRFRIDRRSESVEGTASIGVSSRAGRRSYELIEPAAAAETPFEDAVVQYVRRSEKMLHLAGVTGRGGDDGPAARTIELDLDVDLDLDRLAPGPVGLAGSSTQV